MYVFLGVGTPGFLGPRVPATPESLVAFAAPWQLGTCWESEHLAISITTPCQQPPRLWGKEGSAGTA